MPFPQVKGWKVVATVGEGDYAKKVNISRTFTVKSSAEEFYRIAVKQNPTAIIETVYISDNSGIA
jgi:hypothetical protein